MWFACGTQRRFWCDGPEPPALLLPSSGRRPRSVPQCPVYPGLTPCIPVGGGCRLGFASRGAVEGAGWPFQPPLPAPRAEDGLSHSPQLVLTCQRFPSPPRIPAGPGLTSHFLIARKWLIPPGLVSMALQILLPWPLTSFSFGGYSEALQPSGAALSQAAQPSGTHPSIDAPSPAPPLDAMGLVVP